MKKFALILAGCGQYDGSETHEVILTLLAMAQEDIQWDAFAPDIMQNKVVNHLNGEVIAGDSRSVLLESARLVRGNIRPINAAKASDYDAIVIPGGIGSVNILCNWFDQQTNYTIEPSVQCFLNDALAQHKPMGFICIAPMMIPKLIPGALLTIGSEAGLNQQLQSLGTNPVNCLATDVIIDKQHRLVSTPANMVAKNIDEVAIGIRKCVQALLLLANHAS